MASSHRKRKASPAQARWHVDGTRRRLMRLRYLSALALVTACGSHIRRDVIGSGSGAVQPRGAVAVTPPAGGMTLAPGNYELALRFDVPRAQVVEWTVTCPGVDRHGTLGEPFDAYR